MNKKTISKTRPIANSKMSRFAKSDSAPTYIRLTSPVWPEDGIKSCPKFPEIGQKVATSFL